MDGAHVTRSRQLAVVALLGGALAVLVSLTNAVADVGGQEGDATYECGSLADFVVRPGTTDHRWRVDGASDSWAGTDPRHFIRPDLACRRALFPRTLAVIGILGVTVVGTAAALFVARDDPPQSVRSGSHDLQG